MDGAINNVEIIRKKKATGLISRVSRGSWCGGPNHRLQDG